MQDWTIEYQEWDSAWSHELIDRTQEDFDIMIETDDIIDLSSYEKERKLLQN